MPAAELAGKYECCPYERLGAQPVAFYNPGSNRFSFKSLTLTVILPQSLEDKVGRPAGPH